MAMVCKKPHLLRGEALKIRAEELGASMNELWNVHDVMSEPELQRRVLEADRSRHESKFWIVALVSALLAQ
jgi:hypothetical protein